MMTIADRPGRQKVAVIVAHPDDETLWAGGTILMHQDWGWNVFALCRAGDTDRAPKFRRALQELGVSGNIGDLDDSPGQPPVPEQQLKKSIMALLPETRFDIVITHSPFGEYTRHRRHEETGRAVARLWEEGEITADRLWMFAYEDGGRQHLPGAIKSAHQRIKLPETIWQRKYRIITGLYGFDAASFEAQTTPWEEAFWCFSSPAELEEWLAGKGEKR